jgi:hypothetical protein
VWDVVDVDLRRLFHRRMPCRALTSVAAGTALLLAGATAEAQSWAGGRPRPSVAEIVSVDATGEGGWIYGSEQLDPSVDIRTAYATVEAGDFWARVYLTDTVAPGNGVTAFVFIDSDQQSSSGGGANAAEIDPQLDGDTSGATGFEVVVGIGGDESITGVWTWSDATNAYEEVDPAPTPAEAEAEVGADTDPIQFLPGPRGYLQARVDLAVVGVGPTCDADLYFRTVNADATDSSPASDSCVATDADGDGVPDVVEPPPTATCDADEDCPLLGVCEAGACILPTPCVDAADCEPNEDCSADGRCVPDPGGSCTSNDECQDGLVCSGGTCVGCALGGDECGDGRRCGPDGRCFDSVGPDGGGELGPGEEVRGGAFTCALAPAAPVPGPARRSTLFHVVFAALAAMRLATRRSRRGRSVPRA